MKPNDHAEQQKRAAQQLRADIRAAFSSDAGRAVLAYLESSAGCARGSERPIFEPLKPAAFDPLRAAFADGRRSVVFEIRNLLAVPETEKDQPPEAIR